MRSDEHVILVHGLARSHRSFTKMAKALDKNGYTIVNVNYPSRKQHIETLANEYLSKAVKSCKDNGAQRIHFITHSMGAILARYYLNQYTLGELGHVVMLSPPNQGSEVVDKLKTFPGFYALNGPAGQQLGTSKNSLPNRLGAVDYPVGVITGNRTINPILSLLIPGENDGKVSIERAKVLGMSDYLVVPHTHTMIMHSDRVINSTISFIQDGRFSICQPYPQ